MRRLCAVVLLVVAAAVPAAIAGSTDSTPLTGAVSQTDKTWFCLGPVNLSSVTVVIKSVQSDAVHLAAGCTGTIGKLTVVQYQRDGVKVAPGAHDLTVGGGSIRCYAHDPGQHQDGIQAMGGQRVTFVGMDDRELPTDIVCRGCYLAGGGFPVRIAISLRSGIQSSQVCPGKFGTVRISPGDAQSPVDVGTKVGCKP